MKKTQTLVQYVESLAKENKKLRLITSVKPQAVAASPLNSPPAIPQDIADTDDITEGSTNLYYTDARVLAYLLSILDDTEEVTWTYNSETGLLTLDVNVSGGGALDDLSDVTITSPLANQILQYNGSAWVNTSTITLKHATLLVETSDQGTLDGFQIGLDNDFFGSTLDAVVFRKTDANSTVIDGGFAFTGKGTNTVEEVYLAIIRNKVGVNKNNPAEALDVNGTVIATGYKSSDGTAGATSTITGLVFKNGLYTSGTLTQATTSAQGISELATSAEISTGTDTERTMTADAYRGSDYGKRSVTLQVYDSATALATGDGKFWFVIPKELNGWNLVYVQARVAVVSSSGAITIQIRNGTDSQDMLSTRVTIDQSEKSSETAATAHVINASYDDVATDDELFVDIDGAGTGTKGLQVTLTFQKPGV